jgi:hypothetical protein
MIPAHFLQTLTFSLNSIKNYTDINFSVPPPPFPIFQMAAFQEVSPSEAVDIL